LLDSLLQEILQKSKQFAKCSKLGNNDKIILSVISETKPGK